MSNSFVHPTAVVDDQVELGDGVRIWHFVHVSQGARIGPGTSLGQNVFVGRGVRVGSGVKVQNNVSIYEGVEIEDDVFLGPSCVFTNVFNPRSFVERKREYRPTVVERGASVGANATIVCGVRIGAYAFVGAGATVTRDVAPHALVTGVPARRSGWMCKCGEKLPAPAASASASIAPGSPARASSRPASRRVVCEACRSAYRVDGERCEPDGVQERDGAIPLLDLAAQNGPLMPAYRAAFERVMSSGQFILGPEVEAFEAQLCETFGFAHAITVSSGTDALLLALMALDIGPGDEVITTPFSFFATAGCVARLGARPVFVDIDPRTFNLDPVAVARAITPNTRAILPVHLFGRPADLHPLLVLAEPRGIAVIEDAAQALGATYRGAQVGTIGTFGCFSFFPSKNLGGFGDGGLLTTTRADLAERARVLRAHGSKPKYYHARVGGNFRLDALQCALLSVKLPELERYTEGRRRNAAFYDAAFDMAGLGSRLVTPRAVQGHVYNQYVVRTPERDTLRKRLSEAGIGSEVYYPLGLHMQECFASLGYKPGDMPETERACAEVLAIPVYAELGDVRRQRVVDAVIAALG
jgi:dTDP-4-amino-4,6-dideoxygalactose transaminase/acetyltransferase-like isoleucine patch superfamily enzyme